MLFLQRRKKGNTGDPRCLWNCSVIVYGAIKGLLTIVFLTEAYGYRRLKIYALSFDSSASWKYCNDM